LGVSSLGFRVFGLGFEVRGFGFWVWGSGFVVLGFRVLGFEASVQGSGFRIWGLGLRVRDWGREFWGLRLGFRISGFGRSPHTVMPLPSLGSEGP
jgi:hypothetical protein